jgi:hypothetical protein
MEELHLLQPTKLTVPLRVIHTTLDELNILFLCRSEGYFVALQKDWSGHTPPFSHGNKTLVWVPIPVSKEVLRYRA